MTREIDALIVDDSVTTRKMIIAGLKQTGLARFVFTEAEDGLDALAKYRPGRTEIVFVDMNMPKMDGIEFVRELHIRYKPCAATVMMTAESSQERIMEGVRQPGVDAFLIKPIDRDRLRSGLKTLVDSIPERSGLYGVPHGEVVPQAFREILVEGCQVELAADEDRESVRLEDTVFGLMSIHGSIHWSVVLGFGRDAAVDIASRFSGCNDTLPNADMGDALGEITNIVGSRIKLLLSKEDLSVKVSMPTVLEASGLRVLIQRNLKGTADHTHFSSPAGKLWTRVSMGMSEGVIL